MEIQDQLVKLVSLAHQELQDPRVKQVNLVQLEPVVSLDLQDQQDHLVLRAHVETTDRLVCKVAQVLRV